MKIVIAGGSGFLGRPLAATLAEQGHDVVTLTRGDAPRRGHTRSRAVAWTPNGAAGPWASEIDGAAAVVNLAGEPIAGKRWSAEQKQRILDSRVQATRSLVAALRAASSPPAVFVSGSAVGYYGPHGDEVVTEETPAGTDFLAHVCVQWEAEALAAATARTRVVCVRTGIVLEKDGGALPQMMLPFKFGAGGPVGSGRQYMPWIHRLDWIALVRWAIETSGAALAINGTAPAPVTSAEFARALGKAMRRPAFMPAPGFALRLALGEMADALLLSGQRAVPSRPEKLGFTFRYPRVEEALAAIV
jgi:uncharacterized protein (TIGR01777 family)